MSFFNTIKALFTAPPPPQPTAPPQAETETETHLPETNAPLTEKEEEKQEEQQEETTPEPADTPIQATPTEEVPSPEIDGIALRSDTEFCGLMLEQVILAHRTWVQNLEAALRGQNPSIYKTKLASDDRLSELGIWLYQNEKIFSPYPEYHMLIEMHKRFHECAGEVVEHHRNGHFADAILLLRRDLSLLSEEVQKSLINLHEQVKAKGGNICG